MDDDISVDMVTASMGSINEQDDWDMISFTPGTPELSIESALLWCLTPAVHGIKSIGVLPASERARKLLESNHGDTTAAVIQAAGGEGGGSKRAKIIFEFLLRQVPFIGCPAYILTSTWTHLRAVSTIAAIYGHDLDKPRTQHEVLWCLLPAQTDNLDASLLPPPAGDSGPISVTAKTVSNILISTALKRTVGVSMVTELFQLGTDLWAVAGTDEDGFERLSLGPSATARHYFCPESQFSNGSFFLALAGVVIPFFLRLPAILASLLILTAAIALAKRRTVVRLIAPYSPTIISYMVFGAHAALPVLSISGGISLFLQSLSIQPTSTADRISLFILALMSVTVGLKNVVGHLSDLFGQAHIQIRRAAVMVGIVLHLLPLLDRKDVYSARIAWMLSDTKLSSGQRSLQYLSVIVSSTSQAVLVSMLKRRDVILKLLGAERIMILSLTLFFRGVSAAVTTESLLPFFRKISPHPIFCCLVMTLRSWSVQAAVLLSLVPLVPLWSGSPAISLITGLAVGTAIVTFVWREWKLNENAYMSNMRLLYILPGVVTGRTKDMVDSMLKAGGRTAFKSILASLAKRLSNKIFKNI
jgi:hypothetical protein